MTDDDIWFAEVLRFLGRPPLDEVLHARRPNLIAAAVISKPQLTVATVKLAPTGLPDLRSARSAVFELDDRSSQAARTLSVMVTRFVTETGIKELYLRTKSPNGQYVGHPFNFKMETILQLIPELCVRFIDTNSVGAWVRREDPLGDCKAVNPELVSTDKHIKALEAALYVAEYYGRTKYFSDGRVCYE